ncbi:MULTISPECIES: CBS domain-containing protein [Paraliobacillus]|uniref:CBS domain-containing protein n=1 Tax=Paraliobacillus TaxID=200903 RepID=UPI000DD4E049|nr:MULTISPECIES: CBS domain-containing protein [Paraliobacillus]
MKTVKDIMTQDVTYCSPDDSLIKAAEMMKQHNVGAIPVCQDNKEIMGMVTDRDLVLRGYALDKPGTTKIKEVMTDHLITAEQNTNVQEASSIMAEHQIRRLPIVENKKIVGIVALGDLSLDDKSNMAAGHALEEISERPELH